MNTQVVTSSMRFSGTVKDHVLRFCRSVDASYSILPARKVYAFCELRDAYRDLTVRKNAAFWLSHMWNILKPATLTEAMVCPLYLAVNQLSVGLLHDVMPLARITPPFLIVIFGRQWSMFMY
jgi:hypothetical protein